LKAEQRTYKASFYAGFTDILIGLVFYLTGFADWYYAHFHVFGVLGLGMILYSFYHWLLYKREHNV